LLFIPGTSEMLRAEGEKRKPATLALRCKGFQFNPEAFGDGTVTPELRADTRKEGQIVRKRLESRLDQMLLFWNAFKQIPEFQGAKSEDMPNIVKQKQAQIKSDLEDMRGFYRNHRIAEAPPAEMIDEKWAHFRWIQIQLVAGLDFYASYGLGARFKRENLIHELFDLDYLLSAILVGGLASREHRKVERFNLLRPDGAILNRVSAV
jgi:hypothetical protein